MRSDKNIAETMLWKTTESYEDAIDRLNRTIKYQKENYAYVVCLKSNDEPIGFAGIKETKSGVYEESGICIAQKLCSGWKEAMLNELGKEQAQKDVENRMKEFIQFLNDNYLGKTIYRRNRRIK